MSGQPGPDRPGVRQTGWRAVSMAALVGAGLAWLAFTALAAFGAPLPQLPGLMVFVIAALAVLVGAQAFLTNRIVQVRHEPMPARRGVALLVLGKAALLAGAGLAGGYLAIAVHSLGRIEAALPRERLVSAVVAAVASVALAVSGALLERACRIPRPPDADATPPSLPESPSSPV